MKTKEINKIFNRFYNGDKNLITPNILGYYSNNDNLIAELSSGGGLNGSLFYGITILENNGVQWKTSDLSNCFNDFGEARHYLKSLKLE